MPRWPKKQTPSKKGRSRPLLSEALRRGRRILPTALLCCALREREASRKSNMRKAATKTTAFVATAAAIGFTSLFGAVSPANATGDACTATGGTLLDPAGNVCEMKITAGNATFQPTAAMTKLEVLLVGGGGAGAVTNAGYAPGGGGGGGQVKVVGFDAGSMSPVTVTVGSSSRPTTAAQGSVAESAGSGAAGSSSSSGMNGSGERAAPATPVSSRAEAAVLERLLSALMVVPEQPPPASQRPDRCSRATRAATAAVGPTVPALPSAPRRAVAVRS